MENFKEILQKAQLSGLLNELALYYYDFFGRLDPSASVPVRLAGVLAVQFSLEGHSCFSLETFAGKNFCTEIGLDSGKADDSDLLPNKQEWISALLDSQIAGRPGCSRPLIVASESRIYLFRYWQYEARLAEEILRRYRLPGFSPDKVFEFLSPLFVRQDSEVDWQKAAVATAALKKICIISGGPGTGKTYTVVKIIALFQKLSETAGLRIGLAAPTGKAASRMQESIKKVSAALGLNLAGPELLSEPKTIHRLLGPIHNSPYFLHNKKNKLKLDVLIIDEVSMVDLALMVKMLEALPDHCMIIMLGDKDQLSSVEAGRVLSDLCFGGAVKDFSADHAKDLKKCGVDIPPELICQNLENRLADSIVLLSKSYRFNESSGIAKLASYVLDGDAESALQCLNEGVSVRKLRNIDGSGNFNDLLADEIIKGYRPFLTSSNPQEAFSRLAEFQVLCAHRHGRYGVDGLNSWIEIILTECGLIESERWYSGRPVMVTGNHYQLGLFNGDLGIVLPAEDGRLRVYFRSEKNELRSISPARMPDHLTAYAITVHKSQGSEFNRVVLVLPEKLSQVVSRELIYTAVTRAKEEFVLSGSDRVFEAGLQKKTSRLSGLTCYFTAAS